MKIIGVGITDLERHKIKQALLTKEVIICEDRHTHVEVLVVAVELIEAENTIQGSDQAGLLKCGHQGESCIFFLDIGLRLE